MEIKSIKIHANYGKRILLMVMRTFIFLLCTTVFSLNTDIGNAQEKVKINQDKVMSIDEVFDMIIDQTKYSFIYPTNLFKDIPKVQVRKGVIRVGKLLQQTLPQGKFNVILGANNRITIKDRIKDQQQTVSGAVTDEAGLPMPGVVVLVKGTTNGVATNFDGTYSITVSAPENVLVFSFLGFKTQEITVGNQTTISVTLQEDVSELSEVVVTGYQQISKERSTGSFAKPEMTTLANRTTSQNVLQRLDGLIPGLVLNNAPPSRPFASNSILIRGLSTIDANNSPLFVVDGVVLNDVSSINPQDVEDITVLKDASAASIWGARASNGVIVITTKRGGFNKRLKVDYDSYINFQGKPDLDYKPVLNSQQFIQTARELFDPVAYPYNQEIVYAPSNGVLRGVPEHYQILYDLDSGLINQATADARLNALANTNNLSQIEDLLYSNAHVNNHTLSVQGGGDKHAVYGSLAYTDSQSFRPGEKNSTYKLNLRQDFKVGKRINLRLNTDLTHDEGKAKRAINADNTYLPYYLFQDANGNNLDHSAIRFFSNEQRADLENITGKRLDYIPLDEVDRGFTNSNGLAARISAGISIDLLKGLKFEGTYGYFQQNNKVESYDAEDSYRVRSDRVFFAVPGANPGDPITYNLPENGGYYRTSNTFTKNWTLRNQLTYDASFNDGLHKLTALAGYEAQEQFFTSREAFTLGYDLRTQLGALLNYDLLFSGVSGVLVPQRFGRSTLSQSYRPFTESDLLSRFTSFYANAAYTFNNKYTINGSFRADESNNFGIAKSAQNRPVWSAGLKWALSKENFMSNIDWIDNLSLRGTLGITGNSPTPGGAASFDVLRSRNAFPFFYPAGVLSNTISTAGNKNLSWESTKTLNLGLDFGLFNNRIRGSFDYYERKTEDLINTLPVNIFTGFTSVQGNVGNMENKGIELSLQTLNIDGAFSWRSGIILGYNESELTQLNSSADFATPLQPLFGLPSEGYNPFAVFAFNYAGLNDVGDPQVELADGTITANPADAEVDDLLYMGTYQPIWSGGFSNSFSYKGFTLSANMVYNLGHVLNADTQRDPSGRLLKSSNVHPDFLNRWQQPGDEATTNFPAHSTNARNLDYFNYADIHVVSGSYIKLRDISLVYDFSDAVVKKINASRLSFRLMLNNLMLWKENDKGIDPEFHDALRSIRSTPINQKSVTFGMHLTF